MGIVIVAPGPRGGTWAVVVGGRVAVREDAGPSKVANRNRDAD